MVGEKRRFKPTLTPFGPIGQFGLPLRTAADELYADARDSSIRSPCFGLIIVARLCGSIRALVYTKVVNQW